MIMSRRYRNSFVKRVPELDRVSEHRAEPVAVAARRVGVAVEPGRRLLVSKRVMHQGDRHAI